MRRANEEGENFRKVRVQSSYLARGIDLERFVAYADTIW
jgi:hypothetical protein